MSIIRWDPFRDVVSLRDAMNRLFEESFIRPAGWPATDGGYVAVDVMETKDDVIVKASVPGIKPEDIDISVTGDLLTIKGEFKAEQQKGDGANIIRQELRHGSFERTMTLPTQVVADKAKADFEHGMLTLTLPKAEDVKPKTIKVKAK